jgi:ribonuclease-3
LTQYKIALVREETLARTAKAIELDKTIRVWLGEERRNWRENETILCDCLEALVGYLYLDWWRELAFWFVERYVFCYLDTLTVEQIRSYKSLLQELSQKYHKITPTYTEVEIERDDAKNHIMYESIITLKWEKIWYGQWTNKKKAQEIAAKWWYEYLLENYHDK